MKNISRTILCISILVLACSGFMGCSGNFGVSTQVGSKWINPSMLLADRSIQPRESEGSSIEVKPGPKAAASDDNISLKPELSLLMPWGNAGWAVTWGAEQEGDQQEKAYDVAWDKFGGIYVTGNFANGLDFSAGQDPYGYDINSWGESDIFLSKFNSKGEFEWACGIGGDGSDNGYGVATDSIGCVYVTGYFEGEFDFDPHVSRLVTKSAVGKQDIFLTKYDKRGRHIWTQTWGGYSGAEQGFKVAVDGSDNVCVIGHFSMSVDFDPTSATDTRSSKGSTDVFISKFNKWGEFQWVRTIGGGKTDIGYGITMDDAGNIYATGFFRGVQVDLSAGQKPGGFKAYSNGEADAFLVKFDPDGGFEWARSWGGDESDYAFDVALSPAEDLLYVCGYFQDTVAFPSLARGGSTNFVSNGQRDAFVCKLDTDGNFKWARTIGGTDRDQCMSVAVDGLGNIYATGFFSETVDFNPAGGSDVHTAVSVHDCFLTKYSPGGQRLWTHTWGSHVYDEAFGVAADPVGGAYVTGNFSGSVNFATTGFDMHIAAGVRDLFLCSYPPDGNWGEKLKFKPVYIEKTE